MTVRARVEVTAVEDRQITFRVEVWDEVEKVGEAEHRRAVIDMDRFLRRTGRRRRARRAERPRREQGLAAAVPSGKQVSEMVRVRGQGRPTAAFDGMPVGVVNYLLPPGEHSPAGDFRP